MIVIENLSVIEGVCRERDELVALLNVRERRCFDTLSSVGHTAKLSQSDDSTSCPQVITAKVRFSLARCPHYSLEFNVNKSRCIVFDSFYKKNISPLLIDGNRILSCLAVRYLGVHLVASKDFKFDLISKYYDVRRR